MIGYKIVNLKLMVDAVGEDTAQAVLSTFSCPLNEDVEKFLHVKAIDFAKQGFSQTHLVMTWVILHWQINTLPYQRKS